MGTICSGGITCASVAFSSSDVANNGIIAVARWNETSSTNSLTSCTDSENNSYTVLTSSLVVYNTTPHYPQIGTEFCVATGIAGGTPAIVTCHFSSSASYEDCNASEFSYTGGAPSYLYATNTGILASPGSISAGIATAPSNSLAFVSSDIDDGTGSDSNYTAGSGWTLLTQNGAGAYSMGWEEIAASGSTSGDITSSNAGDWVASLVVIK
jgi:hypothetical protein